MQVSAYYHNTCATLRDGSVMCWGDNDDGQLGNGSRMGAVAMPVPGTVRGLSGIVEVRVGANAACARSSTGSVTCWGRNLEGLAGIGTAGASVLVPDRPVLGLTDAVALSVGELHACALRRSGSVVCWGFNQFGQLGNGTTTNAPAPVAVSGLAGVTDIIAGGHGTCARSGAGVSCWGGLTTHTIPEPVALP